MDKSYDDLIDHKFFGVVLIKSKGIVDSIKKMLIEILTILNNPLIDIKLLKTKISFYQVLEMQPSLRSLCWKILLQYLPPNSSDWENYIDDKRSDYDDLKRKYLLTINSKKQMKPSDHPLNEGPNSQWKGYFQNTKLNEIINKDMKRTRNEEEFFTKKNKNKEAHIDVIQRILLLYARKHTDVTYVQGLNEIVATIYYCFSLDQNLYFSYDVEADTFFCFENLITVLKDHYIQEKDYTETGVYARIAYVNEMLKYIDYELYSFLKEKNIQLCFFAFKWYTLLFAQEFALKGVMRIWDFIFCQNDIFESINALCLSVLKIKKQNIMKNQHDFSRIMDILGEIEDSNINQILTNVHWVLKEIKSREEIISYSEFVKTGNYMSRFN